MDFVWKVGGEAGFGVMGSGVLFAKVFTRNGYYAYIYPEYPSLIKGGLNTTQVRISDKEIGAPVRKCHLLVALNRFAIQSGLYELDPSGGVIYDGKNVNLDGISIPSTLNLYDVPLFDIARNAGGDMLMQNTVAMGASLALIGNDIERLEDVIRQIFGRKGEEVVNINIKCARGGYDYVKSHYNVENFPVRIPKKASSRKLLVMTGNEAISAGAIQAGMRFFAAYPMTPASSILHYIAEHEYDYNIIVKHAEDEIAAMNMVIGAAYAGVRAMCSTSGGGFALKAEALGLAALAETPVVVVLSQRTGPSTGMPTWTEQADLRFAMHASQGDFLRVILAPGDVEEAYILTQKAFNIAEKYQIPVIVLSDKFLSESASSVPAEKFIEIPKERGKLIKENMAPLPPHSRFKRYEFTEDGVSPRPIPGVVGGEHVATSYEHWENGFSTEHFETRKKMVDKRARKVRFMDNDLIPPTLHGPENAEITLVCWGSHKTPVFEAVDILNSKGIRANALHFSCVHPLHSQGISLLEKYKGQLVIVENNSTAQFGGYLREKTGISFVGSILRYDARPLFPEDVAEEAERILTGKVKDAVVYERAPVEYYTARIVGDK
ncbi:MAG: 2-oxoacid:acceptor oxidoreductase subunit alpha [Candidatus Micrarchaeia archaeon]